MSTQDSIWILKAIFWRRFSLPPGRIIGETRGGRRSEHWRGARHVVALCREADVVAVTYGLPLLPLFAVHRGKDGCWKVLVPESDPHEPMVRTVMLLQEPYLNEQPDVPARLTKVARFRGRTGGAGGAWSR